MAFEKNPADDDDADALIKQLGGTTPGTSTTQPVAPPTTPARDPRDPRYTSANAPRVSQDAAGGWQLQEHGNTRALVGDEVGNAKNYTEQFWKDNPTGWQANNPNSIGDAYQQALGRAPDAGGLEAHKGNPGGFGGVIDTIVNSDEAQQYAASRPQTITSLGGATKAPTQEAGAAGAATTPPPAAGATARPTTPFQGFTPKYAMEGFDTAREQNIQKSAKDAFAYLSQQAPPPPLDDKAKLADWFNTYIKPGMNELGHTTDDAQGDKFHFKNWQGDFNVDYGARAGAPGGALSWQVDDPSAVASGQAYTPRPLSPAVAAATADKDTTTANDQLQAEIEAIINGSPSPVDQDALLEQLQV